MEIKEEHFLSVNVLPDSFSFCISDNDSNKIVSFKHYDFELQPDNNELSRKIVSIIESDPMLDRKFKQVRFVFASRKSTIIPDEYFDMYSVKKIFELNHDIDELDEIHVNTINSIRSKIIFTVPNYIATSILRKYQNVRFYNQATPIIYNALKDSRSESLHVNINGSFFDFCYIKDGTLAIYNTFTNTNAEEFVYYMMHACLNMNISDSVPVLLSGNIDETSEHVSLLKRYRKDVCLTVDDGGFSTGGELMTRGIHKAYGLIHVVRCE